MLIADCHDFFSLCIRTEFHARHIARILSAGLDLPGLSAVVCGSNIVDVIKARLSLKKVGDSYIARCPFHNEKTPSFTVNEEKQFYFCLGCGVHGDANKFIADFDNMAKELNDN